MADKTVVIPQHSLKPLKIVKWKVNEGNSISIGCVILLYKVDGDDNKETLKLKSTKAGTVHKIVAQEGDVVKFGEPLLELQACIHPTVMKDMCAECGADLRKDDLVTTASVPMIHSVPELKVSVELAQKLGKADSDRLLKDRKLVLLVDLDQTLIHTTNDNIPANIKDVYHFQLYGPNSPWYHTRLRPGTHRFLTNMSSFYELHICTFGARNYAHMIAMFLDQDGQLFSHRILSRDECFNPNSKTANLKALFPCGDNMVCIIDDREDVWSYASNLIHVKPYHFFQHTGDINAPPGLDKHEDDDKEGVDLTKAKAKPIKVNGSSIKELEEDGKDHLEEENNQDEVQDDKLEKNTEEAGNEKRKQDNEEKNKDIEKVTEENAVKPVTNDETDSIEKTGPKVNKKKDGIKTISKENGPKLTKENDDIKPSEEKENSKSTNEENGSKPIKEDDIIKPIEKEDDTKSTNEENGSKPVKNDDVIKPSEKEDDTKSTNEANGSKPTREEDSTKPAKEENNCTPSKDEDTSKLTKETEDSKTITEVVCKPIVEENGSKPIEENLSDEEKNIDNMMETEETNKDNHTSNNNSEENVDKSEMEKTEETKSETTKLEQEESREVPKPEERREEPKPEERREEPKPEERREDELIEIEDPDDYLMYLEEILKIIHKAFYEKYDKLETGEVPDLKKVIPDVRGNVLKDAKLVFSGLVPTHIKLEQSKAYQVARSLGAMVTQDLETDTTHLVAVRPGTAKVNVGRRKKSLKIVTPDWLWACAERWERVEEKLYPLSNKGSKNRHPPPHCSSPEHIPNFEITEPGIIRKRTPSGRFMDTINPLMSFSSADIADMDREVEDIFNESESESETKKQTNEIENEEVIKKFKPSKDTEDESSSSDESLTGEHPHGWNPKNSRKRTRDDQEAEAEDESTADEFPSTKFRRGEELSSDLEFGQDSNSEGSVDAPDEIDDGDWNMMGAALEREFLSNN